MLVIPCVSVKTERGREVGMQVLAARLRSGGLVLLQWDDELYVAVSLLLQGVSLLSNGASLAESLYGLRRAPTADGSATHLNARQRLLSLLFLVCNVLQAPLKNVVCCSCTSNVVTRCGMVQFQTVTHCTHSERIMHSWRCVVSCGVKLRAVMHARQAGALPDAFQKRAGSVQAVGPYLARQALGDPNQIGLRVPVPPPTRASSDVHEAEGSEAEGSGPPSALAHGSTAQSPLFQLRLQRLRARAIALAEQASVWAYDGLRAARAHGHVTLGLLNLAYQFCYLLNMTPHFSPALHIAGLRLIRDDGSAAVRP